MKRRLLRNMCDEERAEELERRRRRTSERNHQRYIRKKADIDAYNRAYYQAHREEICAKVKAWRRKRQLIAHGYKFD